MIGLFIKWGMKKLHYGLLDIEMTCDGKQENGKFIDVRPTILKAINCKNYRKSPGLFKIAERLNVKIKGEQHNALNDAVLLYGVCRELNIQMSI